MIIKSVHPSEMKLLQSISRQIFFDTFAAHNTPENMEKYLSESFSDEALTKQLADENAAFYFVWLGDEAVGYLKLNFGPSQTELQDEKAVEIERIYVHKAYQGKNVGQLLFEKAIQVARARNAEYVWLGVWEKNERAIRFYAKNGFVPFDEHVFILGEEVQTDVMMKMEL